MKKRNLILTALLSLSAAALLLVGLLNAAEVQTFQVAEFALIRWAGRENSYVIRPNGNVEKLATLFQRYPRPEGVDERAYYMTIAMNPIAKEGYELGAFTQEQIVMRRPLPK